MALAHCYPSRLAPELMTLDQGLYYLDHSGQLIQGHHFLPLSSPEPRLYQNRHCRR